MRAGQLNKSIVIEARTDTADSFGQPVPSWARIHTDATIAAAVLPNRGGERFTAAQVYGESVVTFRIRWRSDVSVLNRISYDSKYWDIKDVREIGRREGLEIDAAVGAT